MNDTPALTSWQHDLLQLLENGSSDASLTILSTLTPDDWTRMRRDVGLVLIVEGNDALFEHALDCMAAQQSLSADLLDTMMLKQPLRLPWLARAAERVAPHITTEDERYWAVKAIGGFMRQGAWEAAGVVAEHVRTHLTVADLEDLLKTMRFCLGGPSTFVNQLLGPEPIPKLQTWSTVKWAVERRDWDLAGTLLVYSDETLCHIYLSQMLIPEAMSQVAELLKKQPDRVDSMYGYLQAQAWGAAQSQETQEAARRLDMLASLVPMDSQRRWCALNPGQMPITAHRVLSVERAEQATPQEPPTVGRPRRRT